MKCENKSCGNDAPSLYQLGGLWVCAPCVPDTAWREYPRNWKLTKAAALKKFTVYHTRAASARRGSRKELKI